MPDPRPVFLLVSTQDDQFRMAVRAHLQRDAASAVLLQRLAPIEELPLLDVPDRLRRYFAAQPSEGAIVLSDQLVEDQALTSAGKDLFHEFAERLYATVAVMDRPMRILDIDRCVRRSCSRQELFEALQLCQDRLDYLRRPERRSASLPIRVRILEYDFELMDYFRLRHRVYTPMSYLDEAIEEVPSGLEIDWFDTRSVHVGAFAAAQGHEELVGTARLITTEPLRPDQAEMTLALARTDPILDDRIRCGAVQALLPVFQSQGELVSHLDKAVEDNLLIGEVSRVIVAPEYRGAGISRQLTDFVVELAKRYGVFELFLECLPIHEALYRGAGFHVLPHVAGKVYSVNKTMCVMHRPLRADSIVAVEAGLPGPCEAPVHGHAD